MSCCLCSLCLAFLEGKKTEYIYKVIHDLGLITEKNLPSSFTRGYGQCRAPAGTCVGEYSNEQFMTPSKLPRSKHINNKLHLTLNKEPI